MANIIEGTKKHLPEVLRLINELAEYERAPEEVSNSLEQLTQDFSDGLFHFLVAQEGANTIGISLYFYAYSTWKGKTLYLEDLYVEKAHRGKGVGKQLFEATVKVAGQQDAKRMAWQVLDWNTPAIEFYKSYGAELDGEWINCRFREDRIKSF